MTTTRFNGERLKNARIFRGMSLADLAKKLSEKTEVTKQALSQYENGSIKPEINKLFLLSEVLKFPTDYFTAEDSFNIKTEATYFRSLMSTSKIDRSAQSKRLEFVAQIYETLFDFIDFPHVNIPSFEFIGAKDESEDEARRQADEIENVARELRKLWKLGVEPINELKYTLESKGIVVTQIDPLAEEIDAFSQRVLINKNPLYIIAISPTQNFVRSRFDMAHELAHILLHPWSEDIELLSREEFKDREKQANMFANAFLLPIESFGQDVKYYPTNLEYYRHLKSKWNVSIQAMIYRAHHLNIISATQYQYLWRQISKYGWRTEEPDDKPYEMKSNLLQGAVDLLFKEKELTPSSFMLALQRKGIVLHSDDVEDLIGLRRGTLKREEPLLRLVKLKPQES